MPHIINTYIAPDGSTFEFLGCDKKLSAPQMKKHAEKYLSEAAEEYFQSWLAQPGNLKWTGDKEKKKSDIFATKYRGGGHHFIMPLRA